MNMDKKIRAAFQSATPGSMYPLPAAAQQAKIRSRISRRFWNALPTVASVAILIAALVWGAICFQDYFGAIYLQQPTDPGASKPTPAVETTVTPTEPIPQTEEIGEERAVKIALEYLLFTAREAENLAVTGESDGGYQVFFSAQGVEYTVSVHRSTGEAALLTPIWPEELYQLFRGQESLPDDPAILRCITRQDGSLQVCYRDKDSGAAAVVIARQDGQKWELVGIYRPEEIPADTGTVPEDTPLAPPEPDPTEPDPTEPDPTEPDPVEPDPTEPDPTEPDSTEPEHVCAFYYEKIISPTCTEFGTRINYCTCGKETITGYLAPTGHSWGQWYTVQEPTAFEEGLQECVCTVCGEIKTDIILKLEGYSGTLGDNLTWTLDGNGLLTVSGTGEMHSVGPYNAWQPYRDHIRSVVIEDGVTTVGHSAFDNCIYLETVTLPEGIREIEKYAFDGCSALRTVSIPSTLVTIGGWAFHDCENLEAITLPEGLTSIGKYAFAYCAKLKTIRIPDTVITIGDGAFQLCRGLEQATLSASLKTLGNSLFLDCQGLTEIEIPESVTTIEAGALNCPNLRCVTLGGKLAKVAVYSFGSAVMEIHYRLTTEEWSQVMKDVILSSGCIVYCTDGEIVIP